MPMPICGQAKTPNKHSPAHARQASESSARRMVLGVGREGEEEGEGRGKKERVDAEKERRRLAWLSEMQVKPIFFLRDIKRSPLARLTREPGRGTFPLGQKIKRVLP